MIKGDIFHCAICNSQYTKLSNLPRVLYCGDCFCEKCIRQLITPVPYDKSKPQQETANQIKCIVCEQIHIFKLIKKGFIICNERYVKLKDEQGFVNYFGKDIKFQSRELLKDKSILKNVLMDRSISIP